MDHWNKLGIKEDFIQWMHNIQDDKTLGDNYLTINKLSDITKLKQKQFLNGLKTLVIPCLLMIMHIIIQKPTSKYHN